MRSAPPLVALALAATVLLSGCVPQAPDINPPPELTTEPVFASDEEALAAATDAYKAYLAMSDLIAQEGGKDPERIAPFVTEEWLETEIEAFESMETAGTYQTGESNFDTTSVQQVVQDSSSILVSVYVCLDLSNAELLNREGQLVTPIEQKRWPFEASFERELSETNPIRLTGHMPWDGANFCE